MSKISQDELAKALSEAGHAHHDYEQEILGGKRDELWPGFYAAFALGRLGNFAAPSVLSSWLGQVPITEQWSSSAADYVLERMAE